ncbi:hypothetical protein HG531_010353 [Fusarium graminearum]|nr:hypothetical protein HG531_010353 [Fusarium graminearum]
MATPRRITPRATPTPTPAFPPFDKPLDGATGSGLPDASAASESPDWVAMEVVHDDSPTDVVSGSGGEVVAASADVVDVIEVLVAGEVGNDVGSVAVPYGSQYCSQIFQ